MIRTTLFMAVFYISLSSKIDMTQVDMIKYSPNVGLEPTTLRLRVSCSTD